MDLVLTSKTTSVEAANFNVTTRNAFPTTSYAMVIITVLMGLMKNTVVVSNH